MTDFWNGLGVGYDAAAQSVTFRLFSKNAGRVDLYLYDQPRDAEEKAVYTLNRGDGSIWSLTLPLDGIRKSGIASTIFYGYRAWGPNWGYDPAWTKGSAAGFVADVDQKGNRFNPNKLLIDPYAREISHDPLPRLSNIDPNEYHEDFYTGDGSRDRDTGAMAPKGVVLLDGDAGDIGAKPQRLLKDDIIYEVHLRGLTMGDPSLPQPQRGTFLGAAAKAGYLKELGVTAVEFLPVFAFANEQNDDGDPRGDNYWGYMSLAFCAPNRRYSSDKTPGGPTREFKSMVRAFHDQGIKVFLDVAFNHTGEGIVKRTTEGVDSRQDDAKQLPDRACLLSLRGLDNASYYELRSNPALDGGKLCQRYQDNSACGANLKVTEEAVRHLVLDSLRYWSHEMGVDGFRFDLAPVLGNCLEQDSYRFDASDPDCLLRRLVSELPVRNEATLQGVDLIAEPWALGDGTYQLGNFPQGWSEWNDVFRDTFRRTENKAGVEDVLPWQVANHFAGSQQQFARKQDPRPCHSINYLVSHDGYTLRDLYAYTGESISWDHNHDLSLQRKAVRNALAIMMVSAGVPMITGGDELFRSLLGRTNTASVDDQTVYLDWERAFSVEEGSGAELPLDEVLIRRFATSLFKFRRSHSSLRPGRYFTGSRSPETGLRDIAWYGPAGEEADGGFWNDRSQCFLGFRIDASQENNGVASIYVGYNWNPAGVGINLPPTRPGASWRRVCDTAGWMERQANWDPEQTPIGGSYFMHDRSVAVFVES